MVPALVSPPESGETAKRVETLRLWRCFGGAHTPSLLLTHLLLLRVDLNRNNRNTETKAVAARELGVSIRTAYRNTETDWLRQS